MILSARKCGCPVHDSPQSSKTSLLHFAPSNLQSCSSLTSTETEYDEDDGSCGCGSSSEFEEESKPRIYSDIVTKGMPYKEIEAIINDNRMVVRIQKEKPREEFEPPCDCIDPKASESQISANQGIHQGYGVTYQKNKGCRTISVYPHPDQKIPELQSSKSKEKFDKREDIRKGSGPKSSVKLPTVNPEENPNIFVLKIKRKCEDGDKKHNLDLEFKAPRPWHKRTN